MQILSIYTQCFPFRANALILVIIDMCGAVIFMDWSDKRQLDQLLGGYDIRVINDIQIIIYLG